MVFEVRLHRKAETFLSKLHVAGKGNVADHIIAGLEKLSEDPVHPRPGADILPLKSIHPRMYRLRIGQYRIIYEIDKRQRCVNVTMILHRKRAYKK